ARDDVVAAHVEPVTRQRRAGRDDAALRAADREVAADPRRREMHAGALERDAAALAPEDVVLDDEPGRDEVSAAFLSLERGRYASTPDQHIIAEHGAEQGALEADGF